MSTVGCYRYAPVESPRRGMDVRAMLTAEAAVRRSQGLDEPIMRYSGLVVGVTPDSLALDVLIARSSSALQDVVLRDTVNLATSEIQTVMLRQLSVPKTALFTVAAGAGAVAVVLGIDQLVGGTGDPPDDGTPPAMRSPWLSWQTFRLLLGHR